MNAPWERSVCRATALPSPIKGRGTLPTRSLFRFRCRSLVPIIRFVVLAVAASLLPIVQGLKLQYIPQVRIKWHWKGSPLRRFLSYDKRRLMRQGTFITKCSTRNDILDGAPTIWYANFKKINQRKDNLQYRNRPSLTSKFTSQRFFSHRSSLEMQHLVKEALASACRDGELCVVETPLKSPYFVPYVAVPSSCLGCVFPNPQTPTPPTTPTSVRTHGNEKMLVTSVHVLQSRNSHGGVFEITLEGRFGSRQDGRHNDANGVRKSSDDVIGESWVAIILSNEAPEAPPLSSVVLAGSALHNVSLLLLTRTPDEVDISGMPNDARIVVEALNGTEGAIEGAKQTFGFVSSFTKALDANKVTLHIGEEISNVKDKGCNEDVTDSSPLAECMSVVKKQTSGCYHENMIGMNKRDIHIIEIEMAANSSSASVALEVKGVNTLAESQSRTKTAAKSRSDSVKVKPNNNNTIKRNLTLVLRSNQPTAWTLRVTNLQGIITLLVGSGDQVENKSASGEEVSVAVRRLELPKSFDQMILHVLTSIGPPVSYTKTKSPDIITLVVPPKMEMAIEQSTVAAIKESIPETISPQSANSLINNFVTKECQERQVSIALPIWVAERVGGVTMTLRDATCRGFKNGTHFVLVSQYSECGFVHEVTETTNIYTNFAHIQVGRNLVPMAMGITDDEDFEGSGYGLEDPYRGRIPTVVVTCKKGVSGGLHDIKNSLALIGDGINYILEVFRDKGFSLPYQKFPVVLSQDGIVYAKLSFSNDVAPHPLQDLDFKLLIEKCWLSPSANGPEIPLVLIRKSCAVEKSVQMERDFLTNDVKFAFQLSPHYVQTENLYLLCEVGVCSQDSLPKPSIKKCVDPESYCRKHFLVDVFMNQVVASRVSTLIIGPFILQSSKEGKALSSVSSETEMMTAKLNEKGRRLKTDDDPPFPVSGKKTQIIVMEGLSTEVVVGIAIASFVIGVCLTATLWLIYMKTDPRRQKRPESQVPRNSGYDLSAHSGSSTPSSQAPMTA